MAETMKGTTVFWGMRPCGLLEIYRRFAVMYVGQAHKQQAECFATEAT
jgi:hypothetical protein